MCGGLLLAFLLLTVWLLGEGFLGETLTFFEMVIFFYIEHEKNAAGDADPQNDIANELEL